MSSGILYSADHTMELLYETLYKLRVGNRFNGYIHVKTIPGASPELVERLGFLADRMSINLELPTADGLARLRRENRERKSCGLCARYSRGSAGPAVSWDMTGDTGRRIRRSGRALREGPRS